MAKCDLCGKSCKVHELQQLLPAYQVDDVEDICTECTKWANKVKGDLLLQIPERMREAVKQKIGMPQKPIWMFWSKK